MATESTMLALGTPAPSFTLPEPATGATVSLDELTGPALVVTFICNHCPYVRHIEAELGRVVARYPTLAVVGICTNDAEAYPDDRPERLADQARRASWTFPYLLDTEQTVGRAFAAACTPDFFVFDRNRKLVYRGQMDDSRPGNGKPNDGADLRAALDAVLAGRAASADQKPSIGCNIKWRPGTVG